MEILETFKIALSSIKTNKTRSSLTALGIIIGVASVILLVSIGAGLKAYINQQFEELGSDTILISPGKMNFENMGGREDSFPGASANKLTLEISEKLEKRSKTAESVLPISVKSLTVKFGRETLSTSILGTTEEYALIRNSPAEKGRFFSESEVSGARKVVVIGKTIQKELFLNKDPLGELLILSGKKFKVIGILEEKGSTFGQDQDNTVIIPITTAKKQFDLDKLTYIYVKTGSIDQVEKASKETEKILEELVGEDSFSIVSPTEILTQVNSILSTLTLALGGIAAISLLVGGIGIMNIMLVSVTERTKEIGLRKAIGAQPKDIMIQFLIESVVLSILGGTIGILIGSLGSAVLGKFLTTRVTFWSIGLSFGVSTIVGVVFGVMPAAKAAKLNPIQALRHE
ncbi:ABC transporter permease [Patescibacteria group bacterium]|nr:ABC transporter permease [Patescibacteria group bacterium]